MAYRMVKTNGGETLSEIAAREGISHVKGSGFYQLQKKESVSADKILVLWNGTSFDTEGVRQKLGVGNGKVDIHPGNVPPGQLLFVNSTSPNRKIEAGSVVFQTGVSAPVGSSEKRGRTGKAKKGRSKKKKGSDEDPEEDEDGEGGDGESGLINWELVTPPGVVISDGDWYEDDTLVPRPEGAWADCDAAVPQHLLQPVFNSTVRALREFTTWTQTEALQVAVPPPSWNPNRESSPQVRYQWTAAGGARLMYLEGEEALMYALEVTPWKFGLVLGEAGAHPFIRAQSFMYDNSDGSGNGTYLSRHKVLTPELVLTSMIRDLIVHANDGAH